MDNGEWENGLILILGVWLAVSPWVINTNIEVSTTVAMASINSWTVGILLFGFATMALVDLKAWEEWINIGLGLWLMTSPWILGYSGEVRLQQNALTVGFLVTFLSIIALTSALRSQKQKF